jgi:hypothetical protein
MSLLAIAIVAYFLVSLGLGWYAGQDAWKNGNPNPRYRSDFRPPHHSGHTWSWFFAVLIMWPLMAVVTAIFSICKVIGMLPWDRLAGKVFR